MYYLSFQEIAAIFPIKSIITTFLIINSESIVTVEETGLGKMEILILSIELNVDRARQFSLKLAITSILVQFVVLQAASSTSIHVKLGLPKVVKV